MLASETQEITDYLYKVVEDKFGKENIKNHFANTRDTLCYATNDNQTATQNLMAVEADIAIVVGGYNSSNTTHLVELLEKSHTTFFIKDETELNDNFSFNHFNISTKEMSKSSSFLSNLPKNIILSSGASCPDATIDKVLQKVLSFYNDTNSIEIALKKLKHEN